MNTSRAGRASKERPVMQNPKPEGFINNPKTTATAEQMRLASILALADIQQQDPEEVERKIKQLCETTGKTEDAALLALHDSHYDLPSAATILLENQDQDGWTVSEKSKKKRKSAVKSEAQANDRNDDNSHEKSKENEHPEIISDRGDSDSVPVQSQRTRRDRGPPRFQRGRGRERTDDDRNKGDTSQSRDRERGGGRGRGRGGAGRGRGRGRGRDNFRGTRFDKGSAQTSDGPHIDTWTNEQAEVVEKENIGAWGEVTEDWTADEWTGPLDEAKVFTSSVAGESKVYGQTNDNDAQMFKPPSINTQVFKSNSMPSPKLSPPLSDGMNTFPIAGSSLQNSIGSSPIGQNSLGKNSLASSLTQNSLGQATDGVGTIGQGSIGQNRQSQSAIGQTSLRQESISQNSIGQRPLGPSPIGQGSISGSSVSQNTIGQRLDLGMLLPKTVDGSSTLNQQPPNIMSQFAKEATESIKNAVGIGSSGSCNTNAVDISADAALNSSESPINHSAATNVSPQQRARTQRTKLPPPSKIPASAVEMPGGMSFQLKDVEFGNWDGAAPAGDSGFSFGAEPDTVPSTNYTTAVSMPLDGDPSVLSSHLSQVVNPNDSTQLTPPNMVSKDSNLSTSLISSGLTPGVPAAKASGISAMDSRGQSAVSTSPRNSGVFQKSSSTPPKDFSQSTKIATPPDPIPFPSSQPDRKTSPYNSQRNTQSTGALSGQKPVSSPMTFSQSNYSTSYQSSSFKPGMTTASFTHPSNSLSASELGQGQSGAYGYSSSTFQNQTTFPSSQGQNMLYPNGTQQSGSAPGQNSLYPKGAQSGSFQAQTVSSAAYSHSGSSYQSQSGSFDSQSGGGSYQGQGSSSYQGGSGSSSYQNQSNSSSFPNQTGSGSFQKTGSSGFQSQTGSYTGQSGSSFNTSQSYSSRDGAQTGSSSYPSGGSTPSGSLYSSNMASNGSSQSGSLYSSTTPTCGASQTGSAYPSSVTQSSPSASYQRDSQSVQSGFGGHQGFGSHSSGLQGASISANKLSDSLGKMSVGMVKDSGSEQNSQFDHPSSSSAPVPASLTTTTNTTSTALAMGTVSISSTLGLTSPTTSTASASGGSSLTKTSQATKAPPNLPPGVPLIPNYMIGQPGLAPFAIPGSAQQAPVYSYEDLQLLQRAIPLPVTTTLTGRDQPGALGTAPYSGTDNKLARVDAQSPVNAQTSSQQQGQSTAHQQAFINPTLPPGYNYYYPSNVLPAAAAAGGYPYAPTIFPVANLLPSVTNTAHGSTTGTPAQFQKPGAYQSHSYGSGGQAQDFSKVYGGNSQGQNKASVGGSLSATSSASDLTAAAAGYGKTHPQSFDKAGFHASTPPPFNLPLPPGTQAGSVGAPAAYGAPYVPMMPHQPHSQILHLPQDSSGSSNRGSQQSSVQGKGASSKNFSTTYWGAN